MNAKAKLGFNIGGASASCRVVVLADMLTGALQVASANASIEGTANTSECRNLKSLLAVFELADIFITVD